MITDILSALNQRKKGRRRCREEGKAVSQIAPAESQEGAAGGPHFSCPPPGELGTLKFKLSSVWGAPIVFRFQVSKLFTPWASPLPTRRGKQCLDQHQASVCGTKGYDHDKGNCWYNADGQYNSHAACSAKCLEEIKCLSFAYSKSECMLFNIPLKGNFDADKGSADTYDDRGCLSAPAVEKKPTKTTTTTTSKSSTVTAAKSSSSTSKSPTAAAATPRNTPKSSSSSSSNTAAVATTPSSTSGAASTPSTTASASPDFPTAKPYESKGCPMPKALAISDLKSTVDSKMGTNTASVKIQYGNGTFSCPGRCASYQGQFNCICDLNGLLNVYSDGQTYIYVQQWYWCDAQEQRPNKAYQTLALTFNFTMLADYVTCCKSGTNTTCTQSKPLLAPVGGYGGGGTPGFAPMDINGNYLPNCPSRPGHS